MASETRQLVQRLWGYCSILRDDGLSYPDYVEQLTYLLFLKMADEQALASPSVQIVPEEYSWPSLIGKTGEALKVQYSNILRALAASPGMLGVIFFGADNKIRDAAKLRLLVVDLIDRTTWTALDADVKGDAYEGLLEKNAQDTKSGAGQYFTPRPVVDAVITCMQPRVGETVFDPACGTGGFLTAAHRYMLVSSSLSEADERQLNSATFWGVELVHAVARLATMNLLLHGIGPKEAEGKPPISVADSLAEAPSQSFDVILTNPPFGKRSSVTVITERDSEDVHGLSALRSDLWTSTSNKELNFLQHVANCLSERGRAAVVIPDGVLTAGGPGEVIRRRLMHEFDVHTLLRLPTGIFYAQGVNANVLFFDKRRAGRKPNTNLWCYDLRSGKRFSLAGNPIQRADLHEFEELFLPAEMEKRVPTWSDSKPLGRWRSFTHAEILDRSDASLDLFWIDDSPDSVLPTPKVLNGMMADVLKNLQSVVERVQGLAQRTEALHIQER